jgi:hypothetical protein
MKTEITAENQNVKKQKTFKRISALDFLRGFGIIGVIGFHAMERAYDINAVIAGGIENIPWYSFPVLLILGFLGPLYTVFIFVSGIGNVISMDKKWYLMTKGSPNDRKTKNIAFWTIFWAQIKRGALMIFFGYVADAVFNHFLVFLIGGETIEAALNELMAQLFHSQIISTIGWGVLVISPIYLLMKRLNFDDMMIREIFLLLGILIILAEPRIIQSLQQVSGYWSHPDRNWRTQGLKTNLLYLLLTPLGIGWFPMFPNTALTCFGVILGMEFREGKFRPRTMVLFVFSSMIFLFLSLYYWKVDDNRNLREFFLSASGSLVFISFLLYFIDYRGSGTRFARKTKVFGRMGQISFSLWSMQWLMIVFVLIVQKIMDKRNNTKTAIMDSIFVNQGLTGWQTWLMFFIMVFIYHGITYLWQKGKFILSIEWIISKLISTNKKAGSEKTNMADVIDHSVSFISREEGRRKFQWIFGPLMILYLMGFIGLSAWILYLS